MTYYLKLTTNFLNKFANSNFSERLLRHLTLAIIILPIFFTGICFAAKPQTGSIAPSSGSSAPEQQVVFTSTYSDQNGWTNIKEVCLLINTSSSSKKNCFYVYYDQNSNKLYLRKEDDRKWLGGYAPGTNNIIANSYAKLDCAQTIVSGNAVTLTVSWSATFKASFLGNKNSYLYVSDDNYGSDGWDKLGTWTISANSPPQGSIIINSGDAYTAGSLVVLTLSAQDPDGLGQMKFSHDNTNWSTPEAYSTTKNWTLQSGIGTKTVYVKFSDTLGSWSNSFSDQIFFDNTAPVITAVVDDGETTYDLTQLHASWSAQDESPITEYQYAIGTTQGQGGSNILGWTSAGLDTQVTASGLSLLAGQTYYFNVKAKNILTLWSDVVSSDGITALGQSQPPKINSIIPENNSTFTSGDIINIVVQAQGGPGLEYRYSVDGSVIRDWTASNTYPWQTQAGDIKLKTITVEVRNQTQATDAQDTGVFLFRKPPQPE